MSQIGLRKQTLAIGIIIFLAAVGLSGCTDTQNTDNNLNRVIGTWNGSVKVSTFGPMGNNTVTMLTFMEDTVAVTLSNERGTYTMNYTYTVNGDNLVLKPTFHGGMPGRPPFNGTRPFNGTLLPNGTWPFNGTLPSNGTRPFNDTRPPNGERPSMSMLFIYGFNEEYDVLYLNGSPFNKVK